MKKYIVVDKNDPSFSYIVDDIMDLINEMYDNELTTHSIDTVKGWFMENHLVFITDGNVSLVKSI